jgi:hypothetical protein
MLADSPSTLNFQQSKGQGLILNLCVLRIRLRQKEFAAAPVSYIRAFLLLWSTISVPWRLISFGDRQSLAVSFCDSVSKSGLRLLEIQTV